MQPHSLHDGDTKANFMLQILEKIMHNPEQDPDLAPYYFGSRIRIQKKKFRIDNNTGLQNLFGPVCV